MNEERREALIGEAREKVFHQVSEYLFTMTEEELRQVLQFIETELYAEKEE